MANDVWGWTDPTTAREYVLLGRSDGTAFIDVTSPVNPVYLGSLPSYTGTSVWRGVKVYADRAYIVSDRNGSHGVQVFDLTQLRGITVPTTFSEIAAAHYDGVTSAHNIAINEQSGFAYIVGSDRAAGGLHILDIRQTVPVLAGEFFADGYTHDVQVVNYGGPDADHAGREIAFASNEDTLTIVDVTNKSAPTLVARTGLSRAWLRPSRLADRGPKILSHGRRIRRLSASRGYDPEPSDAYLGRLGPRRPSVQGLFQRRDLCQRP